ncbi:hypothetical protein [Aeoliella sp.]|uniref:hypothetical protein n=1 Tax=Aeoliella sp. TaxID=2795800 RepID=UPI003CCBB553
MSHERSRWLMLGLVVLTAAVMLGPSEVLAQRKSPGGLVGEERLHPGSWANQRASRSVRHARDYSWDIYRYSRDAGRIEPAVAKSESEELGRNIAKGQKELATASADLGSDSETVAAVKSINEHLAAAAKHHAMLHEECCKDSIDGSVCMICCNNILLELDKAQAEHNALMRSLEVKEK